MVAYFIRRLAQAAISMFALTFLLYTLLVYSPGGVLDLTTPKPGNEYGGPSGDPLIRVYRDYKLSYPWTRSFFVWLFDPSDTTRLNLSTMQVENKGLHLQFGNFQLKGSGILTGDWGESYRYPTNYEPVQSVYGIDLVRFYSLSLGIIFSSMLLALLQRRGRPAHPRSSHIPARQQWRPADLWRTG